MIVVVGCGLVGSATARHLAEAGRDVLLVGPPEEPDPRTARAFASHHDRARVVRQLGHDPHWTALNRRAIAGMEALQRSTGRRFRSYEGCLYTSHTVDDPHVAAALAEAEALGLPAERLDPEEVPRRFPDLTVPCGDALFEAGPSGHVDPRGLKEAQLQALATAGGQRLDAVVRRVDRGPAGLRVHLDDEVRAADKVVVATGPTTGMQPLLPEPRRFDAKTETILLAEVEPRVAEAAGGTPALLDEGGGDGWQGIYGIRPLTYPDGRTYLKMGCNLASDRLLTDLDEVRTWFVDGPSDDDHAQLRALTEERWRLPLLGSETRRCLIVRTPHRRPYLEEVDEGWFLAAGGNGYAAMNSDGIGQVMAHRVLKGGMPDDIHADAFR